MFSGNDPSGKRPKAENRSELMVAAAFVNNMSTQ